MIINHLAAPAQPVIYAGGLGSTSRPGFAQALQATLAGLQATQSGTAALINGPAPANQAATMNGLHRVGGNDHGQSLTG